MKEFTLIAILALMMLAMLSYDPTKYRSCVRFKVGRWQFFLFRCWYSGSWKISSESFVFPFGVISWR